MAFVPGNIKRNDLFMNWATSGHTLFWDAAQAFGKKDDETIEIIEPKIRLVDF
jgi:hypothetical protein